MVVFFYYPVKTPQDGQCLLEEMDIPGEAIIDEFGDKNEKCIIWKDEQFIAIHYKEEHSMELYPTKNTNSIAYFEKRFPNLRWDRKQVFKTKRWS